MPFRSLAEVEFNFIWVGGGPMPEAQAQNLLNFILMTNTSAPEHRPVIRIWVDNEETYKVLTKQLKILLAKMNAKKPAGTPPITFKETMTNLSFRVIKDEELDTPPELKSVIERARAAKLWSGMSDIYRLLILSRKHTEGEPHARFYCEADNLMLPPLWNFFKSRDVGNVYNSELGPMIFIPCDMRTDLLYLDIASAAGKEFADSMRPNLLKILCEDPVLKIYLSELLDRAIGQQGLAEHDVLGSFGMLVIAMFRLQFMSNEQDKGFGFKEIAIPLGTIKRFHGPLKTPTGADEGLSWLDKKDPKPELYSSVLWQLIYFRIIAISDTDGIALKKTLERFRYSSVEEMQEHSATVLKAAGGGTLPAWFEAASKSYDAKAGNKPSFKS